MQGYLIASDDPAWDRTLARIRHDFYHLPDYVALSARRQEPGTPVAFIAEEGERAFLLPLILREIPPAIAGGEGWGDATSGRHYPGPIAGPDEGASTGEFVAGALDELVATLRAEGVVSAFVRLHPLLSPPFDALQRIGDVVEHGDAVSIDLDKSVEQLWSETRQTHRHEINKGYRNGYRVRIDPTWERFDDFLVLHRQTMDRLEAAPHWRLGIDDFLDLRATLGDRLHLCVVERDDELAAAILLVEEDGIIDYHVSATAPAHIAASPTKLSIDFARRWAKERGARVLHLGGSLARDDSLIQWKLGFSRDLWPVASWRVVVRPDAYDELVRRRDALAGTSGKPDSGFFPRYREPIAPAAPTSEAGNDADDDA